ncbi:MAG: hypothetical protein IT239_06675 [Bacteroidia bacterium]|nr:hypothetical protein [Bacteroidia bacterium]
MRVYFLLFSFLIIISSCIKRKEFPPEPIIKFKEFTQTPDTAFLKFSFTDGDGDLGLNQQDTSAPFNFSGNNYYNIYIKYFEKHKGVFQEITLAAPFNYRFKRIQSPGRNKAIEGEMKIKIQAPYYSPFLSVGDTVKYDFYIKDRALHVSNTETTGDVIIKY